MYCYAYLMFCFSAYIFSLFWEQNVLNTAAAKCNWRWKYLRGRPHPQSSFHLIPLSNSKSWSRPIFHEGTVGRSEAELLSSKQVPRFFPLLSPKVRRYTNAFWENMAIQYCFHLINKKTQMLWPAPARCLEKISSLQHFQHYSINITLLVMPIYICAHKYNI